VYAGLSIGGAAQEAISAASVLAIMRTFMLRQKLTCLLA
jgi:hypothetical protein